LPRRSTPPFSFCVHGLRENGQEGKGRGREKKRGKKGGIEDPRCGRGDGRRKPSPSIDLPGTGRARKKKGTIPGREREEGGRRERHSTPLQPPSTFLVTDGPTGRGRPRKEKGKKGGKGGRGEIDAILNLSRTFDFWGARERSAKEERKKGKEKKERLLHI